MAMGVKLLKSHRGQRSGLAFGSALLVLFLPVGVAHAQSMDYGALENLFGEPVTTSVTGAPQRARDVPASMIIVTADEIRRSGAHDIPGILRHVPGINVLQWTNDQADLGARGYNQAYASRLLVLVDGRQVYADSYGFTPWSTLPVELADIRQIEVVMGPNSALFGFNAVGGVINIITYDPLYDDINTALVRGGTQNLIQGSATTTFKLADTAGLRISVGGWQNDGFSTPQRSTDIGSRSGNDRKSIDVLAHARFGDDLEASFELSHSEVQQTEITPLYVAFLAHYRTNSLRASLSADTAAGLIEATAYSNWISTRVTSVVPPAPVFGAISKLYVARLSDVFKIGSDHTFRISGEYRHDDMGTMPLAVAHIFYDVVSGAAMWSWGIQPGLTLTNAVRIDHLALGRRGAIPPGLGLTNADWDRRALTETSFNSGVVWQPDPVDTIRVTVARGVQLPNLLDLGGLLNPKPPFGYAGGIPTLKPTIVTNYEASWGWALPAWNMKLRVRAFHQTTRDIVSNFGGRMYPLGLVSTPANVGRSQGSGAEISLSGTISAQWRWGLSYTPEVISDHFLRGFNAMTVLVDYEHTHPVHVIDANLGWADGPWEVDGYLRYQSQFDSIQGQSVFSPVGTLVRIPDYVSVDARIAYRITDNLTLALSGQNLLDSPQRQTSAPMVERRVLFTASVDF